MHGSNGAGVCGAPGQTTSLFIVDYSWEFPKERGPSEHNPVAESMAEGGGQAVAVALAIKRGTGA
jgi:hypothetical protein